MSHSTYSQRVSAASVHGSSPAIVLVSKTKSRLLLLDSLPSGRPARFLRVRPAVFPFLGVRATAAKFTEFVRKRGAGSIDSLFRSRGSLFAQRNSLFESVGNSGPTDWICTGTSAGLASAMPRLGEHPCIFPVDQGFGPQRRVRPRLPPPPLSPSFRRLIAAGSRSRRLWEFVRRFRGVRLSAASRRRPAGESFRQFGNQKSPRRSSPVG